MVDKISLHNIISSDELLYLEKYFNNRTDHEVTQGMKKIPIIGAEHDAEFLELVHDIIKNRVGIDKEYVLLGDNFYQHTTSYFPHTDSRQKNSWLNILVPIKLDRAIGQQKFIVFDQQFNTNATWTGTCRMSGSFVSNKTMNQRICDTENVSNLTDVDISDELYSNISKINLPKEEMFGLSGHAFDWTPGDVIVFDSKYIHVTGAMQCSRKLGLSIRIGHVE
jgi:hypothetical protein